LTSKRAILWSLYYVTRADWMRYCWISILVVAVLGHPFFMV
jgi:hypothetical protein